MLLKLKEEINNLLLVEKYYNRFPDGNFNQSILDEIRNEIYEGFKGLIDDLYIKCKDDRLVGEIKELIEYWGSFKHIHEGEDAFFIAENCFISLCDHFGAENVENETLNHIIRVQEKCFMHFSSIVNRFIDSYYKDFLDNYKKSNQKGIKESDNRIKCNLSREEISTFFSQLSDKNFMSDSDVKQFLSQSFHEFPPNENSQQEFTFKADKGILKFFMHEFYKKCKRQNEDLKALQFVNILKQNFSLFKDTDEETIRKSFSRNPQKYPFN